MSFANLKRNRGNLDQLKKAAEQQSGQKKSFGDDRLWKPTVDKSGNGYAVIRFLPAPEGEDLPWVQYWDHFFKGPTGQWYVEKSLTTIGQDDPVSEHNSRLWNSGHDEDKETARAQKRRLHYVANILVIKDPENPANEGKVFLYQFGKKIFDKIMDQMQPEFADEDPVNPFDFWEGADFKLKIRNVAGFRNYDKSEFANPSALSDDDEKLEGIYNQLHSLAEFTDPKTFKSYAELKARLNKVLGEAETTRKVRDQVSLDEQDNSPMIGVNVDSGSSNDDDDDGSVEMLTDNDTSGGDDEDIQSYFAKLANED